MGKFDTIIGYVVIYKEAALGKKYKWCTLYLVNPYKIPLFINQGKNSWSFVLYAEWW